MLPTTMALVLPKQEAELGRFPSWHKGSRALERIPRRMHGCIGPNVETVNAGRARPSGKLERESDAAEADENVALGLRESAVYGRNATGARREFLGSEQGIVDDMIILESIFHIPISKPFWNPEVERRFSRQPGRKHAGIAQSTGLIR
jgi:hypothetical protein